MSVRSVPIHLPNGDKSWSLSELGVDVINHAAAVFGWGLISVLARVESSNREAVSEWFCKFQV